MSKTYTVKQAAQILGYSTNSIYTFLKEKRIKGVRLGRGRFRIPEEELNRLTRINRPAEIYPAQKNQPIQNFESVPLVSSPHSFKINYIPSLFDWFAGIGSIMLGISFFLFVQNNADINFAPFLKWTATLRISLIAAGLGLVITDVIEKATTLWHKLFHFILSSCYLLLAASLISIGDFLGIGIFGCLSAVLLLTFFYKVNGITSFVIYIFLLFATTLTALFLPMVNPPLPAFLQFIYTNPFLYLGSALVVIFISGFLFKWSFHREKRIFWAIIFLFALLITATSIWYAQHIMWGKALFMLLTAITSLFVPWWDTFQFNHRKNKLIIFGSFCLVLAVFVSTIGIIFLMQENILELARSQITDDLSYGNHLITTNLDSLRDNLESAAANPLLASSISSFASNSGKQKDTTTLSAVARSIIENNDTIRRVLILNKGGDILIYYPYDTNLLENNFSYRDYFIETIRTGKSFTSDIFETRTSDKRKTVVISTPIFDSDKNVVGVLVASIDIQSLGFDIQQSATNKLKEYFVLVDKNGYFIYHPDSKYIGTLAPKTNLIWLALSGKSGVAEGYNIFGQLSLQAYQKIDNKNWAIMAQAPLTQILAPTQASIFLIYAVVITCVFIIILAIWLFHPVGKIHFDSS